MLKVFKRVTPLQCSIKLGKNVCKKKKKLMINYHELIIHLCKNVAKCGKSQQLFRLEIMYHNAQLGTKTGKFTTTYLLLCVMMSYTKGGH